MSRDVIIIGGGASGMMAALAAAENGCRVTLLERQSRVGRKLLATGNGRCNLDNEGITPESYSSADRAALDALLRTVNAADPLGWFRALGLYTRTDETGRVYPYSNQAADVLALGAANGWVNGSCRKDYGSNDRAVLLQKPEKSC